jgi:NAD(P)-dependent dehydrogenase (short-subunit alcohol dehydrogenase family)
MAELVIEGGTPLRGTLTPSGNKNAAFPLIAAALLTDQPVTLRNLPDISDVRTMLEAMEGLGVEVGRHDRHTVTLRAVALRSTAPDPALLRRIRGAVVLLGPLLARERQVRFGTSGGDQIGRRRIDSHMLGLQALGAVVEQAPDLVLRAERLRGADILLAVDLTSVFLVCRAAVRLMRPRRQGRIVNIASIAGKEGNPTLIPYSSAKAGVIGLTKALAKEVATQGILVHAVAPAVIGTELLQQMTKETVDMLVAKIPMGRVGTPAEVATLVAWLASDECTFTTGAVHDLSGGRATY